MLKNEKYRKLILRNGLLPLIIPEVQKSLLHCLTGKVWKSLVEKARESLKFCKQTMIQDSSEGVVDH